MAGLQHCYRKPLFYSFRLISKNGLLLQPSRSRHHIVFQISPERRMVFQKSKLLFNTQKQGLIYRLASTNVNASKEPVLDTPKLGSTENKSVSTKTEAEVAGNSNVVIEDSSLPAVPTGDVTEAPVLEFISTNLKEPSFESLGLGSWWPSGIIQQLFEILHVSFDLPWWQTIIGVTIVARICLFPINLSVRRDVVHFNNHLPLILNIQNKAQEAKLVGDHYAVAAAAQELQKLVHEKKINMFSFLKTAFIQGPVFLSMYYALRGMSSVPVESLKTGGTLWFTDLTQPDPYYILPVILASTMALCIEIGAEGTTPQASSQKIKWVMRAIPVVVFAFSTRFESCISWYWTVSNLLVLCQVGLFKIPAVGRFLKIPESIKHPPGVLNRNKKGFIEGIKDGISTAKIRQLVEDRERLTQRQFEDAGSGPIPRTFKRNPLLQKENK